MRSARLRYGVTVKFRSPDATIIQTNSSFAIVTPLSEISRAYRLRLR